MGLFTDRPPSAAEDFIEETRTVELAGTHGRDGRPLVVRIRRLSGARLYAVNADKPEDNSFVGRMEEYRAWAQEAVVEPRFAFAEGDSGPAWDRLPMAAQVAIANAIALFSTEGMDQVVAATNSFRSGDTRGPEAGPAGGGPGSPGDDAPGVEAASPNGAHAGAVSGAGIRPGGTRRRAKTARV